MKAEIRRVLRKSKEPLTAKEIVKEIQKRGYYHFGGKTPNSSVCARLITDIKEKGEKSIFEKTERGFRIKSKVPTS